MGLLPIFLILALSVFLWGLVNYNAFVAKRAYVSQLREEADRLDALSREITGRLSAHFSRTHSIATPAFLSPAGAAADQAPGLAEAWRRFAAEHASLSGDVEAGSLLDALEEAADGQYRTHMRLERGIADYNRHRRQMPYRLIALLFGFRPIPQTA